MAPTRIRFLLALALLAGCDSKVTSTLDTDLQQRVEAFKDCFPNLYARAAALLDVADAWRQTSTTPIPDPAGLTATVGAEAGGTLVTVHYDVGGTAIDMTIRFYSPAGVQQTLALDGGAATSLGTLIGTAATELRDNFPTGNPFLVGDYTFSGGGITGSDSLTGILGGSSNQNELEELRTTAASGTVRGGPPATDSATITDSGPPPCTLTFTIPSLRTDESPTQEYPIGAITLGVTGPATTVTATVTFDGSATAIIVVDDVPGSFSFQLATRTLTFVP